MSDARRSEQHPIDLAFTNPPGFARMLTDAQIKEATKTLQLIGGKYKPKSAKYASYELHASDLAEKLVYDNDMTGHAELAVVAGHVVIEPGATVKLYTEESINLPSYIWSLVVALGQLFSAGLSAGSTYVDPGSSGEIYLSLTNLTKRSIKIPVGAPIARAHFFVLGDKVETAHGGPTSRRPVRLRVDDGDVAELALMRSDLQDKVLARLVWYKMAIYVLFGFFVGLAWTTVGIDSDNELLAALASSHVPHIVRLVVPGALLALLSFLSRDVRRTIRLAVRNLKAKMRRRLRDFLDG